MKKTIIIIGLWVCAIAIAANVTIELTVPDAHIQKVWEAMNELAGKELTLRASKVVPEQGIEYSAGYSFTIAPKDPNETNQQFAKRFIGDLLRASVGVVASRKDDDRQKAEHEAIVPDVNVPDEVIQ